MAFYRHQRVKIYVLGLTAHKRLYKITAGIVIHNISIHQYPAALQCHQIAFMRNFEDASLSPAHGNFKKRGKQCVFIMVRWCRTTHCQSGETLPHRAAQAAVVNGMRDAISDALGNGTPSPDTLRKN